MSYLNDRRIPSGCIVCAVFDGSVWDGRQPVMGADGRRGDEGGVSIVRAVRPAVGGLLLLGFRVSVCCLFQFPRNPQRLDLVMIEVSSLELSFSKVGAYSVSCAQCPCMWRCAGSDVALSVQSIAWNDMNIELWSTHWRQLYAMSLDTASLLSVMSRSQERGRYNCGRLKGHLSFRQYLLKALITCIIRRFIKASLSALAFP
ncbi:hypothetical protein Tco_1106346 [Tanacetum coccineum]